jgi:Cupin domain
VTPIFLVETGEADFRIDATHVKAAAGDILIAPACNAHRSESTGNEELRLTAIHTATTMATEWRASAPCRPTSGRRSGVIAAATILMAAHPVLVVRGADRARRARLRTAKRPQSARATPGLASASAEGSSAPCAIESCEPAVARMLPVLPDARQTPARAGPARGPRGGHHLGSAVPQAGTVRRRSRFEELQPITTRLAS